MRNRPLRYHRDIYYPEWMEQSLADFADRITKKPLVFSKHSLDKTVGYSFEYGKTFMTFLTKCLEKESLWMTLPFEARALGAEVRKACYRFSDTKFPVDLTLVISLDGTVVTLYTTNQDDYHSTMDENLYEKG